MDRFPPEALAQRNTALPESALQATAFNGPMRPALLTAFGLQPTEKGRQSMRQRLPHFRTSRPFVERPARLQRPASSRPEQTPIHVEMAISTTQPLFQVAKLLRLCNPQPGRNKPVVYL